MFCVMLYVMLSYIVVLRLRYVMSSRKIMLRCYAIIHYIMLHWRGRTIVFTESRKVAAVQYG